MSLICEILFGHEFGIQSGIHYTLRHNDKKDHSFVSYCCFQIHIAKDRFDMFSRQLISYRFRDIDTKVTNTLKSFEIGCAKKTGSIEKVAKRILHTKHK